MTMKDLVPIHCQVRSEGVRMKIKGLREMQEEKTAGHVA